MEPDKAFLQVFSHLDRHFGRFLEKLSGGNNPAVFLAAALASRNCREGHVCLDLAGCAGKPIFLGIPEDSAGEFEAEMPEATVPICPRLLHWREALRASPVVGRPGEYRPLILDDHDRLYLYRYRFYEDVLIRFVQDCADPGAEAEFSEAAEAGINGAMLAEELNRLFPEEPSFNAPFPDRQKVAALAVLRKRFVVISGSPGTGKTTTAARIIALLQQLNRGPDLRVALAAPTGKAAARLEEAMQKACGSFHSDFQPGKAMTLHRLLGVLPGSPYFRHCRDNPLPYDLVVVDEASMVDLPLMAKLILALPPLSRLLLLGDRDQLASVEAGAVLGDLCGPANEAFSPAFPEDIGKATGTSLTVPKDAGQGPILADSIIFLQKNYRFDEKSGIGRLSSAVNGGDCDGALSILSSSVFTDIEWQPLPETQKLGVALRDSFHHSFKEFMQAAGNQVDLETLFGLFERFRILCTLRRGPYGVVAVNALLEDLLRADRQISGEGKWYPGRPVMITRNDYGLGLYNGDVGLTLPDGDHGGLSVFFRDSGKGFRRLAPFRLPDHETVYAMTVHKSQGSEFDEVLMLLSDRETPLLTRELIYTGITRAKKRLVLWGSGEILQKALSRRIDRISGLRDALWPAALKRID